MFRVGNLISGLCAAALLSSVAFADFAEKTKDLEKKDGLITTYVDRDEAKVLLALDKASDNTFGRYIYAYYLTGGLGSNPLGLDRSLPGGTEILTFRRAGKNMLAVIENLSFRASADNPAEKKAVRTSFSESVIWSTPIVEFDEKTGKALIDLSGFLKRDAVGVAARLKRRNQGNYRIDGKRSYVDTEDAHVFPINLEFDAHLTFAGTNPGDEIYATTPDANSVTLIAHTTFMKMPDDGYEVRHSDERAGIISSSYVDMSAPLDGNTVVQLARRFRLQKDENGDVIKPIVFYIDNGAPEPIRSALLEGANWWAEAFEKAGFPGGYRAEILPEGVHPLDARYNVVNWVHRATRGWSYGSALHDPRTGETLRGVVLLGSLRVRQDIKIFEALSGASKTGTGEKDDPVELALQRIRQLSAHEIGHSLGFSHNMAGSSYGGRASVMDYPAPDVRAVGDDQLDFSRTYGVGVGGWDNWATKFLYSEYDDEEKVAQAKLVKEADEAGLLYVSDPDSRSIGTGHVKGALWDNGTDLVAELDNVLKVREIAMNNFGERNLRKGETYEALQTKFVPLYLYHRYQLQAAAKSLGGYEFEYRHEGDGRSAPVRVAWETQQAALEGLLKTVAPETLDISDVTLTVLSPVGRSNGDPQWNREIFDAVARPVFSEAEAAAVAADLTFDALLHPARLARLAEQNLSERGNDLAFVLARTVDFTTGTARADDTNVITLRAVVASRLMEQLIALNDHPATSVVVRSEVMKALKDLRLRFIDWRRGYSSAGSAMAVRIENALARAKTPAVKSPGNPDVPPGSPIGSGEAEACWHCEPVEFN
ncbi:zinc-dependent metalloprotease [Kordiimonas sp. SCSIO 12603]|uniref:zinc-dependent metalloprotease n=1 Tax=Kordiimonas sp. SCSIO 12603 TaxID=2829596 RepID=UPI00210355DC|nr:zinc-dependent metalloprotease [Kordiimonas sp. SCSIO 12603]UTW58026.1 zinc-dependent metalloprotease [Kordiimonas sp. SCSIO 12603]